MSNSAEKLIQSIQRLANSAGLSAPTNNPLQYKDRQHEYLNGRNKNFSQRRAYLANDYVIADVQGLNPDDFYEWSAKYVRFSDIAQSSSMATRKTDDWKEVMFPQEPIDYFPIGGKIVTMGSTWLNVNPSNMGSAYATAVMARCNSSYNSYDYYGNVVTEPIYVGSYEIRKTATYTEVFHINLMDGNIQITCQYNDVTKKLGETKRLVIGSKVYYITGYADYIQEFTGDRDSVHLLTFTARVEEPTQYDDMTVNFIANGNAEHFGAVMNIASQLIVGEERYAHAIFVHNETEINSTVSKPVTWVYTTSDANVATINDTGRITGIGAGTATITATMVQNPNISVSSELTVVAAAGEDGSIRFDEYKDTTLTQFMPRTFTAHYYNRLGAKTFNALTWEFSGADYKTDYTYGIADDGMSIVVTCIRPSKTPLTVTASYQGVSASITLSLEGY